VYFRQRSDGFPKYRETCILVVWEWGSDSSTSSGIILNDFYITVEELIKKLKSFDLKAVSDDEIKFVLPNIKLLAGLLFKIQRGRAIYRSQKMDEEYTTHHYKKRISYNPSPKNYGRCNLPGQSIFYGSITTLKTDEDLKGKVIKESDYEFNKNVHGYLVNICECSDLIQEPEVEGIEIFTVGMWRVQEDFEIPAIVDHQPTTSLAKEMKDGLGSFYSNLSSDDSKKFGILNEYLSEEFSKPVEKEKEYLYKISAHLSNYILNSKKLGLLYTSVKSNREGYNIALRPELINEGKIELERVALVKIYKGKGKDKILWDYRLMAEYKNGEPFTYRSIPNITLSDTQLEKKLSEMGMIHLLKK